ncbi:MAG: hypothetical protein ACRD1Y_02330, partial [Terriglobales bacterium]
VHETVAPPPVSATPPPPLSTGLSPQVQTAYRDQTLTTLQQAERDVQTLTRRSLTGDAVATREQATEFIRQAQAALSVGDLVRAQTLAAKAETLARFLLGQ